MEHAKPVRDCLADLERRIDPRVEDALIAEWRAFLDGRFAGGIFSPRRSRAAPPGLAWPEARVNAAFEDFDRMALQQFGQCSDALAQASGALLNVRCNYSTAIMPSLFGAELFMMDDEMNTLPTSVPLRGGADAVRALLDRGVPDPRAGLGARVFEMAERFLDLFARHPAVGRYVRLYHPDLQGPLDVCELLWGSALFVDSVDQPELVQALLALVTETYLRFMRAWDALVPPRAEWSAHWSLMHKGRIMLRDDSAMNFSPRMVGAFVAPHDQRLLDELGGGAIHFCGKGDHYIARISALRGLTAIQLSQPEYNDMEVIYRHTVDQGLPLLGLPRDAAEAALRRGRDLRGRVHCW
jgi:hypothetical protein